MKVDKVDFDLDTVELKGGVAVKILVLSIDPYLRGRMRETGTISYIVCWLSFSVIELIVLIISAQGTFHSWRTVRSCV